MFDLKITNVRPYGEGEAVEVGVAKGEIAAIGTGLGDASTLIDGRGGVLLPGFVDLYAVLGEPGADHTETIATGTRAAAKGGYTAVCAAPSGNPVTDTPAAAEAIWYKAKATAACDVYPLATLTKGRGGEQLTEMGLLSRCDAEVPMFSDGTRSVASGNVMRRALEYAAGLGATVATHCEDASMTDGAVCHEGKVSGELGLRGAPSSAEDAVLARDLYLARDAHANLHVRHVSTAGAVELLRWAREQGIQVSAEVTPHNLFFSDAAITGFDANFKVTPPLRSDDDRRALRQALVDGVISCVVSDHTPRPTEEKECEFTIASTGVTSLETALASVAEVFAEEGKGTGSTEGIDWRFIARVMSENPAQIAGLANHGRPIAEGEPANLTLVDPDAQWTVNADEFESLSTNSPFVGHTFASQVIATVRAGELTFEL